jgi:hypothetical protein
MKVRANGRYLVNHDGKPIFVRMAGQLGLLLGKRYGREQIILRP